MDKETIKYECTEELSAKKNPKKNNEISRIYGYRLKLLKIILNKLINPEQINRLKNQGLDFKRDSCNLFVLKLIIFGAKLWINP